MRHCNDLSEVGQASVAQGSSYLTESSTFAASVEFCDGTVSFV